MTKQELKDIKGAVFEIASLQRQLAKIENMFRPCHAADSVKGSSIHFPYIERIYPIEGVARNSFEKQRLTIKASLEISISALQLQLDDAYKLIDRQKDADIRTILRLKYINGLTWPEIAAEVHMSDKTARRRLKEWWAK